MSCAETRARLDDFIDAELDASTLRAFEAHVEQCAGCRHRLERARRVHSAVARMPVPGPTAGFAGRALAAAAAPGRPARSPRLVAAAFVAAFAASILTVIYTGLLVEAPRTEVAAGLPSVSMTIAEPRTIHLVFGSRTALDDVSLLIDLPEGIEIAGHDGARQLRLSTRLAMGRNVLPLELVAAHETRGQLVARLQHGDRQKVFRVHLTVGPG